MKKQIIIYMKKLLDSDWLRAVQLLRNSVQICVILCNYNYKKAFSLIGLETTLFEINQSRATRKWRELACSAWCDEKLDSGHIVLTAA